MKKVIRCTGFLLTGIALGAGVISAIAGYFYCMNRIVNTVAQYFGWGRDGEMLVAMFILFMTAGAILGAVACSAEIRRA